MTVAAMVFGAAKADKATVVANGAEEQNFVLFWATSTST